MRNRKIELACCGKRRTATLVDNEATRELMAIIERKGEVTIAMNDYGGFEKVGDMGVALPDSDTHIVTTPGDIMLYMKSNIVIFYGRNSWSYTRLGKIDNATADNVRDFLGLGKTMITLRAISTDELADKKD